MPFRLAWMEAKGRIGKQTHGRWVVLVRKHKMSEHAQKKRRNKRITFVFLNNKKERQIYGSHLALAW